MNFMKILYIQPSFIESQAMIAEKNTGTTVIDEIKRGNQKYLQELYNQYRTAFAHWTTKHYKVDDEVAGEIYQQAFIAFYYNIKEGKLTQLNSSIKTYLFAIGKNLMREHFKSSKKFVEPLDVAIAPDEVDEGIMAKYENAEMQETIKNLLDTIGEPCKTVIELYYFKQYAMDAIATHLNYKTEQIAAKRKFICLKQLRSLLKGSVN
jgi:RNA polymerase sigma-70 factor (ECF subfamily)